MKKKIRRLDFNQTKESREILTMLHKWITKNYGKRCRTKAAGCVVCEMWAFYDLFELRLP